MTPINFCYYCHRLTKKYPYTPYAGPTPPDAMTRDHVLPKARGGKGIAHNIVSCCLACNQDKGTLTGDEYWVVLIYREYQKQLKEKAQTHVQ